LGQADEAEAVRNVPEAGAAAVVGDEHFAQPGLAQDLEPRFVRSLLEPGATDDQAETVGRQPMYFPGGAHHIVGWKLDGGLGGPWRLRIGGGRADAIGRPARLLLRRRAPQQR